MRNVKSLKAASSATCILLILLITAFPKSLPNLKFRISSNGTTALNIDLRKFLDPNCIASLQFSKEKSFAPELHSFTLGSAIFKNVSLNFQFEGVPYSKDNQKIKYLYSRLYFDCSDSSDTEASFYSATQTLSLGKITKGKEITEDRFFGTLTGRILAGAARRSRSDFTYTSLSSASAIKAPVVTKQLDSKTFLNNQDIIFRFGAEGAKVMRFNWYFTPYGTTSARKLKQQYGLEIISDPQGSTLIIRATLIDTNLYNKGTIHAIAYNKFGRVESDPAQITVTSNLEPTMLPTIVPTSMPTQIATFTATIAASPTTAPTALSTKTPTKTAVHTATKTVTPRSTATRTPTRTSVATATRTAIPSSTATRVNTPNATSTRTPVATATRTSIPSITPVQTVLYIRAGASGNGSDWANALPNLPDTLQRGVTYYLAGGSYGSYVFDDSTSATGMITVRKATANAHGTNIGWQSSYGTERATFNQFAVTNEANLILDGVDNYGIAILSNTKNSILTITNSENVTINEVEVNGNFSVSASTRSCTVADINQSSHVTISNSIIRNGGDDGLLIRKSNNLLFEGNIVTELYGDQNNCNNGHSDGIEIVETTDAVFNRNLFKGIDDTSAFFAANWKNVTPTLTPIKRIIFTNNILHVPKSGAVVYFNFMEDSLVANNTFWQARYVGVVLEGLYPKATTPPTEQPVRNLKMRNNIIASMAADNVLDSSGNPDRSVLDSDYNLIVAQEQFAQAASYIQSANDIALKWTYNSTFPTRLFEDDRMNKINRDPTIHAVNSPDAESFRPASTNPGINLSDESVLEPININGRTVDLSLDYFGNPANGRRDMGAVEFGGTVGANKTLTVSKAGTGTGIVTGNGINCGTDCSEEFIIGSSVTLTAAVDAGSTFTGWSGDCTGTAATCSIIMSEGRNVTATFSKTTNPTDTVAPAVAAFSIPETSASLTVPVSTFIATDNTAVTGYLLTESSTKPSAIAAGWSSTQPTVYIFGTAGTKTLFAWAKDAAGNVSLSQKDSVLITIVNSGNTCNEVSQYGITWKFDRSYPCGEFINGDWWVTGPIDITSIDIISPETTSAGRNGTMVNPMPMQPQAYDNRIADYSSTKLFLKGQVGVNSSVVTAISSSGGSSDREYLRTAAVLTVLDRVPPDEGATIFRPAYLGNIKPLYSASNIDLSKLPNLPKVDSAPDIRAKRYDNSRVQLDHLAGIKTRGMLPVDNMQSYGAANTKDYGVNYLALALDYPIEDKIPLLYSMVQIGIDYYHAVLLGMEWQSNGGHSSGRKMTILFAGHMLNNSDMLNVMDLIRRNNSYFAEDCQTFYTTVNPPTQWGSGLFETLPEKYGPNFARYSDRHCTNPDTSQYHGEIERGEKPDLSTYWQVNSPSWVGQTLAAHLYGLVDEWGHDAYFDHLDRYIEMKAFAGQYGSKFSNDMWLRYRSTIN